MGFGGARGATGSPGAKGDPGSAGPITMRIFNFVLTSDITNLNQTSLTNIPTLTFSFTSNTTTGKALFIRGMAFSVTSGSGTFNIQHRIVSPGNVTVYGIKTSGISIIGVPLLETGTYTVYTDYIVTGTEVAAIRASTVPPSSNATTGEYFTATVNVTDT